MKDKVKSAKKSFVTPILLLVAGAMTVMSSAAISPSLPEMSVVFQDEQDAEFLVKLVLTLPTLSIAIFAPFAGIIIDKCGRKKLFVISIILYGVTGTSGFFLDSLFEILVSRALFGVALAGIMTTSVALIADYFEGAKRDRIIGLQAAFATFGGVIFLVVGGLLADLRWDAPFLIYLLAFVVLPFVMYFIYEPKISRTKETLKGKFATVKITYLIYPVAFLSMVTIFLIPIQIPFHLKQLTDTGNTEIGIAIAISYLFAGVTSLLYKKIKSSQSFRNIFIVTFLLMGSGFMIISFAENYLQVVSGLAVSGAGLGLLIPTLNLCLIAETPVLYRGRVLGGLLTSLFLGQFFSAIVSQPLISELGSSNTFTLIGFVLMILSLFFVAMKLKEKLAIFVGTRIFILFRK